MKKILVILISLSIFSCKKSNIEGIEIGTTLLQNQTLIENKKLDTIIKSTLQGNYNSLRRLNHFPCGEGAGCYEKGFIITQIIYKIGEANFIKMVDKLDKKDLYGIEGLIKAGLEYGDNNGDGKIDKSKPENEFPTLMKKISEK